MGRYASSSLKKEVEETPKRDVRNFLLGRYARSSLGKQVKQASEQGASKSKCVRPNLLNGFLHHRVMRLDSESLCAVLCKSKCVRPNLFHGFLHHCVRRFDSGSLCAVL